MPREKPAQLTRKQLARMTPEQINAAREAGALEDMLAGVKPAPPPPGEPPPNPLIKKLAEDISRSRQS
jgi:hypothetical protein